MPIVQKAGRFVKFRVLGAAAAVWFYRRLAVFSVASWVSMKSHAGIASTSTSKAASV